MASSNQVGRDGESLRTESLRSSAHNSGRYTASRTSSISASHSPTPSCGATYPQPPGPAAAYPLNAACHPSAGYSPVPGGNAMHNPHAYPQGYATYTTEENMTVENYPAVRRHADGGYGQPVTYPATACPPTAPYYGPPPHIHVPGTGGARFLRSFILCCCIILLCILLGSTAVYILLKPKMPIFKILALSVTNFTTTPYLSGMWHTKMSVENPNTKIITFFSDFKIDLMYNEGTVAMTSVPGFQLNTKDVKEVEMKIWSGLANEETLNKDTLSDIAEDRSLGNITFHLKISNSDTVFKSGLLFLNNEDIVGCCNGLKIVFQKNNINATTTTFGTLDNGGKPVECVYL